MSKSYSIKVNDRFEFTMDEKASDNFDLIKKDKSHFHFIHQNKTFTVVKITSDFSKKEYQLLVNGNKYEVNIDNELDQLIQKLGLTINGKQKDNNIKSPMPGLILDVMVKEGQEVKEGDTLLVLEAMKMENMLAAPKDGVIKKVAVAKGNAVEKNQLLIELE